jgi:hypothetical protein
MPPAPPIPAMSVSHEQIPDHVMDGVETQEETQESTQDASQTNVERPDGAHLWGWLQPCNNKALRRIDFWKLNSTYRIGRNPNLNQVVFPGLKISQSSLPSFF